MSAGEGAGQTDADGQPLFDDNFDPEFSWWTPWYAPDEGVPAAVAKRDAAEHSAAAEVDAAQLADCDAGDLRVETRKRQADLMSAMSSGQGVPEAAARLKRVRAVMRESNSAVDGSAAATNQGQADFSSGGFF